jgi:transcriptional antiterminator NusG
MSDGKKWYVVYVGDSKRVSYIPDAVRSVAGDSAVWIPTKQVFYRIKGKLKEVSKPLFPGYVFISTDADIYVLEGAVNSACGGHFLRGPGAAEAAVIDDAEMTTIRGLVESNSKPQSIAERYDLELGQKVEITTGPFLGVQGTILEIKREKVKVEVSIFGRNTSAEVDPASCRVVVSE